MLILSRYKAKRSVTLNINHGNTVVGAAFTWGILFAAGTLLNIFHYARIKMSCEKVKFMTWHMLCFSIILLLYTKSVYAFLMSWARPSLPAFVPLPGAIMLALLEFVLRGRVGCTYLNINTDDGTFTNYFAAATNFSEHFRWSTIRTTAEKRCLYFFFRVRVQRLCHGEYWSLQTY